MKRDLSRNWINLCKWLKKKIDQIINIKDKDQFSHVARRYYCEKDKFEFKVYCLLLTNLHTQRSNNSIIQNILIHVILLTTNISKSI